MVNVYQMVTDRIIEQMQKGIIPWKQPWRGATGNGEELAISYTTRIAYSTINQWLLGEPGEYLTFKQIKEHGGQVRKGAKSRIVVFYSMVHYTEKDPETGEEKQKKYPCLKYYNVFHIKDTEGIQSRIGAEEKPSRPVVADTNADSIILSYLMREATLKFQNDKPSDRAYYSPALDMVVVPMLSQYSVAAEYYSTTFHELVHSTMKESRCNRRDENHKSFFGNDEYSREELVAEIGSAMLCTHAGVSIEKSFRNSVAYIQSWLKALRNDNKMIIWAASRAEKAAKYILNIQEA